MQSRIQTIRQKLLGEFRERVTSMTHRSGAERDLQSMHRIFQVGKPGPESAPMRPSSHNLVGIIRKGTLDPNTQSSAFSLFSILWLALTVSQSRYLPFGTFSNKHWMQLKNNKCRSVITPGHFFPCAWELQRQCLEYLSLSIISLNNGMKLKWLLRENNVSWGKICFL